MGDAIHDMTANLQTSMENFQANHGEQVKQIGTAIAIPIIASTAMGKGVGIFSSQVPRQVVRRSAAPRMLRAATSTRTAGRMATATMRAGVAPKVARVHMAPFSTQALRLQPCLLSPAPQAQQQVYRAANHTLHSIEGNPTLKLA